MYKSKIGSDNFKIAVEQFVSALSQYMPEAKSIICEKNSCFDRFERDSYTVKIKEKVSPRKFKALYLSVNDETCTCDIYDRGCNVHLVDEYGNIDKSWGLMLDCPGYTGNKIARYIQYTIN